MEQFEGGKRRKLEGLPRTASWHLCPPIEGPTSVRNKLEACDSEPLQRDQSSPASGEGPPEMPDGKGSTRSPEPAIDD